MSHQLRTQPYVSRQELRSLRRQVIQLLRSLMYLFVVDRLERRTRLEHTRQGKARRVEDYHPYDESVQRIRGQETGKRRAWENGLPVGLWVAAILIFGFGDSLTSALAFSIGASEANPLLTNLMRMLGDGLWSFIVVKTAVLAALFFLSYCSLPQYGWLVPIFLCCSGTYLTVNNLIAFFGL